MRPTNEERREVAEKLRRLAVDMYAEMSKWEEAGIFIEPRYFDEVDYSQIHDILLGCFPADYMHPCDYEELHNRLADLIEPEQERMCRNLAGEFNARVGADMYNFVCSECGYNESTADSMHALCLSLAKPNYCRMCGAKVVER